MRIQLVVGLLALVASVSAQASLISEVHWLVCEPSAKEVVSKLELAMKSSKARDVTYLDTPGLSLYKEGVVFRVRENDSRASAVSTVKVRVDSLPASDSPWFQDAGFKCEMDRHGDTRRLNCSLKRRVSGSDQFTSDQLQLVRELRGLNVDPVQLKDYGPSKEKAWSNLTLETEAGELAISLESAVVAKAAAPILEISARVPASQEDETIEAGASALKSLGIQLCSRQSSKTSLILSALSQKR